MSHHDTTTATATIFVTGSADGLGRDAARRLVDAGHTVVGHARSSERAGDLGGRSRASPTS